MTKRKSEKKQDPSFFFFLLSLLSTSFLQVNLFVSTKMDNRRLEIIEKVLNAWFHVISFLLSIIRQLRSRTSNSPSAVSSPKPSHHCYFSGRGFNKNCKGAVTDSRKITADWLAKHNGSHLQDIVGEPQCSSCNRWQFDFGLASSPLQPGPRLPDPLTSLSPVKKRKISTSITAVPLVCLGINTE